uniref:Uncharacterized protein n=2 Tax=unclassified Caudoviricetes TaxID=2788787 RepID=A0A8S5Q8A7_9CAUD|nr:MAG TPA: hypothetical protein [Siphoviridae sp. ctAvK3]DAE15162.1 MAG TPA: hypothetical protein [Siphoviridae sp. ctdVv30]
MNKVKCFRRDRHCCPPCNKAPSEDRAIICARPYLSWLSGSNKHLGLVFF